MDQLASLLADAWRDGKLIVKPNNIPWPQDRLAAYAVQDQMADMLGARCIGWKVGATRQAIQRDEGFDGPIPGRIFAQRTITTGETVPAHLCPHAKMEAEIAYRLRADKQPAADDADAAKSFDVLVASDITSSRYDPACIPQDNPLARMCAAIADNGNGGYIVLGPVIEPEADLSLTDYQLAITVNGKPQGEVFPADYRPNPPESLAWVLEMLEQRKITLDEGDVILTGSANRPFPIAAGDAIAIEVQGKWQLEFAFG